MKVLCRVCHDNYADENYCLGFCCGMKMVQVPKHMYNNINKHDYDEVAKLINEHGKRLE